MKGLSGPTGRARTEDSTEERCPVEPVPFVVFLFSWAFFWGARRGCCSRLQPNSLYLAQLRRRLGEQAIVDIGAAE